MNEEALKDVYGLFSQSGYNGSQDEFYTLLSENAEAFADSYGLFKNLDTTVRKMNTKTC